MTQLYGFVALSTVSLLLAGLLLVLRTTGEAKHRAVFLAHRWNALSNSSSGVVLLSLVGIALLSLAQLPTVDANSLAIARPDGISPASDDAPDAKALDALRSYAESGAGGQAVAPAAPSSQDAAQLGDVDTLIAKLFDRLQKQPDDVKGWKMLGWSYLNTGRPGEAVKAYETALKLEPTDAETTKALAAAKTAQAKAAAAPTAAPMASVAQDAKPVAAAGERDDAMIRGMVDRLAARLETSPRDESGWLQLLRSRVTLGETEAAKAALKRALATFADDEGASSRLTATARELGLATD